jgi:hypothetical protein
MTGGTMIQYPEQLILQHEALAEATSILGPFSFDPADMALDVIRDVGPRGHYLKHHHTRRRLRDHRLAPWLRPGAVSRAVLAALAGDLEISHHDGVIADKLASLDELSTHASAGVHPRAAAAAALAEFRRLEREHRPQTLPTDVLVELEALLQAADRRAEHLQ